MHEVNKCDLPILLMLLNITLLPLKVKLRDVSSSRNESIAFLYDNTFTKTFREKQFLSAENLSKTSPFPLHTYKKGNGAPFNLPSA